MEALEAIMSRRSIRKYTDKKIPEETIKTLLEAAMNAPSAHNKQPWHFIVVDDRETLYKVPEFHNYSKMLEQASHAIVVLADTEIQNTDFWIHDTSASTENILIAANALGLGAVWLGVHPHENLMSEVKKLFNVPENVTPLGIISLGYPAEEKPPRENYNEERVHRNKW
ncbi:MAG: nitroreductase family protein [Candidatus Bathyarchaeota archaeon]|nr:nitroreductase family protein [Candidatus Bathyarchaeota archaeon]